MTEIIDIHPHIIASDEVRYPRAPLFGKQSDWSRERPVTVEQYIEAMDAAGVAKAAVVQASTCYGHDNSYVIDSIARYPDRLSAVCSIDIRGADAIEKIAYWHDRGMAGIRLFTGGSTAAMDSSWLIDPVVYPAWEEAGRRGLSIAIQTDESGIPAVGEMAGRFPDVKIVLDHFARPDLKDGTPFSRIPLFNLARHKNVYLKMSPRVVEAIAAGGAGAEHFMEELVSEIAASRIAWGSNFPANEGKLSSLLADARGITSSLSYDDREWIFGKTALTLYPALKRTTGQ